MDFSSLTSALVDSIAIAVVGSLATYFAGILTGFVGTLKNKAASIKDEGERNAADWALDKARDIIITLVNDANQTVVDDLKAKNGGKLTPQDASKIKSDVITQAKTMLSDQVKSTLTASHGQVDQLLGSLIEDYLAVSKKS